MPKIKYLLLGISVFFPLSACRCGGTVSSQPSHASLQPSGWAAGAEQGDYAPATQPEGSASATHPDGSASASPSGRAAGAESGSSQPSGRAAGAEQGDYAPATRPEGSAATRPEGSADNRPEGSAARQWTPYDNLVEVDRTVHDFGDILSSDGPVSCSFSLRNISKEPVAILQVISSCGCTDVEWTREDIDPGKCGKISATYKNDAGAVPFDKALTVYVSGLKRPFVLHLRGVVHEKAKPLSELYGAARRGALGFKSDQIRVGNMEQGGLKTGSAMVANLSRRSVKVTFAGISPQLDVSIDPNPVPAGSLATLSFTVRADRKLWGTNVYTAVPVVDGVSFDPLQFTAVTKENFASMTREQRDAAPLPMFSESTFDAGFMQRGGSVDISFKFTNNGKSLLHIFKAESDSPGVSFSPLPDLAAGESGTIDLHLDTSAYSAGEYTIMLTLYTNSPTRPLVNLFIALIVK